MVDPGRSWAAATPQRPSTRMAIRAYRMASSPASRLPLWRRWATSGEELDQARFKVVHASGNLDSPRVFQAGQYGTAPADVCHRQLDILARHRVHEVVVL